MICPKCLGTSKNVGDTHYICENSRKGVDKEEDCLHNDKPTQFKFVEDDYIRFPHNQIFVNSSKHEFYRKPYLELESVGNDNINR